MGILVGLLLLSALMVIHELGHFLVGRALGFAIEEFAIFMGPVLFSWNRKGIRYSIRLFPIGAFVRFSGEERRDDTDKSDNPALFHRRPRWARALVIGSGPVINLLAGVAAFAILFTSYGFTTTTVDQVADGSQAATAGIRSGDRIVMANGAHVATTVDYSVELELAGVSKPVELVVRDAAGTERTALLEPVIRDVYRLGVTSLGPLEEGGREILTVDPESNGGNPVLAVGDRLLAVDGIPVENLEAMTLRIQESAGGSLRVTVLRNGESLDLDMVSTKYREGNPRGLSFTTTGGFFPGVGEAFRNAYSVVKLTFRSLSMILTGAIRPQDSLTGPIGIIDTIGSVVNDGQPAWIKIYQLLSLFALISVNLGVFNLLPVPALDGSQLILIGIEGLRGGKRLPAKLETAILISGFALIIMLAVVGLVFDVMRILAR